MSRTLAGRTALSLAVGLIGAGLATIAGLPAAPLIGAAITTSAAAWAGAPLAVDTRVRDVGFLIIGLSLGSGFQADILDKAGSWVLSLAILCLSIFATLMIGKWLMQSLAKADRETATLASAPGTMSMAIAMAVEGRGDATRVTVIQSMRLLMLTAILPLALVGTDASMADAVPQPSIDWLHLCLLALVGWVCASLIKRTGFPAALLVGGMAISALAHVFGLVHGTPHPWVQFVGYCLIGSVIGSRFSGITLAAIRREAGSTALIVAVAAIVSAIFALCVSVITQLPIGQVWVAFAPGGVEAMAAIGLAMGFDPAYVAVHHLARISFLTLCLPLVLKR